jgi:adenylate cyclase
MGDQVNLTSRLEGLNKTYHTQLLISESTAQLVRDAFILREVDQVRVVGREQAVRVYELLARAGMPLPREQEQAFSFYAAGLAAYRDRRWDEALEFFTQSLALWSGDGPSRTMADRCGIYQNTPPQEEWNGVFEALQK